MAVLLADVDGDPNLYGELWAGKCMCTGILTWSEGDPCVLSRDSCTRPPFGEPLTFEPLMMPRPLRRLGYGRTGRNVAVTVYADGRIEEA